MWQKLGCIFNQCHAQLPTPIFINNTLRIYYSSRDENNQSFISFFENNYHHKKSILPLGEKHSFDEHGVMISSIILFDKQFYLFYTGWQKTFNAYQQTIGLAISSDGINFNKVGPILGKSIINPYIVNSPNVWIQKKWQMVYSSGIGWNGDNPQYCLRKAHSIDGINWKINSRKIVGNDDEQISRSTRFRNNLLFCYKTKNSNYRMGTIKNNIRLYEDELLLQPSSEGWDSEMICYPSIININNDYYMFYNGNGYGKTGIGMAIWKN